MSGGQARRNPRDAASSGIAPEFGALQEKAAGRAGPLPFPAIALSQRSHPQP